MLHYVAYGDREGRRPIELFDPYYYRSKSRGRMRHVNALLHYFYIGRYLRISPSPWFDVQFYLSQNKDVARSGIEPLNHYLKWGGLEGRSPNPQFDGAYYLRNNPEISRARLNPLLHYLHQGRSQNRATRDLSDGIIHIKPDTVEGPDAELAWHSLHPKPANEKPFVDVIVPVYRDRELTMRCLFAALSTPVATHFELVVIDDCSPDEELKQDLRNLVKQGLITLLVNETNLGFVSTVNRGMALHPERDVLLLNSDTEVYNNWLDRLKSVAYSHPRTATVTPLSNNATICSYPRFLHDNPYPLDISYERLDSLAAHVNKGAQVEAPTGVGFCMYLRRDALNEVGLFDSERFGKGYGEENDYCQRAIKAGWKTLIAAEVFVRHFGGASFGGERGKRVAAAMQVMQKLHPDYHNSVERFIEQDPLAPYRQRLDWARLKSHAKENNTLIVCHGRGGGTERHVQEEMEKLKQKGEGVFLLRPERDRPTHARLGHPSCKQLLNIPPMEHSDIIAMARQLKELNITAIHIHGLVDFTQAAPEHMLALVKTLNVPLLITIHDYTVICPRINLVDSEGAYCGEPSEQACNRCLKELGNDFGAKNIRKWRAKYKKLLLESQKVLAPDADVAMRLSRYFPEIRLEIVPHEDASKYASRRELPAIAKDEDLRVVVVGAIGKIKGYNSLLACARDSQARKLPIKFYVMGYSHNDRLLEKYGVEITGRYLEQEAESLLKSLSPHAVWLPSLWPETYSYTLSLAMGLGYQIVTFNIGAIAGRMKKAGRGQELWPLSIKDDPAKMNERFMEYRWKLPKK